jgi:hypothetical protein
MIALTTDEAVAAIVAAAWTEHPSDEAYRKAVEALEAMTAGKPGPFTGAEIRAAITARVPEPRRLIHTTAGAFGADWTAESAVAFARKPGARCFWVWHLLRHDLMIAADDRIVHFEVAAPAEIRARLLNAERAAIAEAGRG